MREFPRRVPPLVNSSRTSTFFILQPTNTTISRAPSGISQFAENLSKKLNSVFPKNFRSDNGPNDREHHMPSTHVTAKIIMQAFFLDIRFSSIR